MKRIPFGQSKTKDAAKNVDASTTPEPESNSSAASPYGVNGHVDADKPLQQTGRTGGYGGLGSEPQDDTTAQASRQQLFGNVADRQQLGQQQQPAPGYNLIDHAKHQFEADAEDDDMEDQIDSDLDEVQDVAGRLRAWLIPWVKR